MTEPDILARPWVYHRGAVYLAEPKNGAGRPCDRVAIRCPDEGAIAPSDKDRALRACAAVPDLLAVVSELAATSLGDLTLQDPDALRRTGRAFRALRDKARRIVDGLPA